MDKDLEPFSQACETDAESQHSEPIVEPVKSPKVCALPPHLIGLDYTFWSHVFVSIKDLLEMEQHPNIADVYIMKNHPVRTARICGIVVAKDEREKFISYSVDDGTGIIECMFWFDSHSRAQIVRDTYPLGCLISATGRVTTKYNMRKLQIKNSAIEKDPNMETLWWLQVVQTHQKAYSIPSHIPPEYGDKAMKGASENPEESDPFMPGSDKLTLDSIRRKVDDIYSDLDTRVEITSGAFQQLLIWSLLGFMNITSIKYADARKFPQLYYIAKKMVASQPKSIDMERQIEMIFQRAFLKLAKDGLAYVADEEADIYCLIRHDINLGKAILDIIKNPATLAVSNKDGVMEEVIVMLLHKDPRFRCVDRKMIKASLQALQQGSLIYENNYRSYKAFEEE
ncbi:hypothetical protein BC829DRAFT_491389 [Chytridium lagenaria]|nr:hypothetical protein BC829DRAFT_491389 [Chytridium lagenaria]